LNDTLQFVQLRGATLIQLYFHRYHQPVPAERAAVLIARG
jgi:hypothetical protein